MDERDPMTAMARPKPDGSETGPTAEDDPLVELARIVSGRSAPEEPRRRPVFQEPVASEEDLARDLEAELLSDLQATFAAAGTAPDEVEEPADEPPFHAPVEEDPAPADEAEAFPFEREAPLESFESDEADFGEDAYAQLTEDPFEERPPQAEAAPPEHYADEPAPPRPDFQSMALRGNRGGPAFNPSALATPQPPPQAAPAHDAAPPPQPPAAAPEVSEDWYPENDPGLAQPQADLGESPYLEPYDEGAGADGGTAKPATVPQPARLRHRDPRLQRDPYGEVRLAARRRSRRRFYTTLSVLTVAAVAVAAVLVLGGGEATNEEPPLIAANADPVRVIPEPEAETPEAGAAVFDRVNPDEADPAGETLLEGAEPVADIDLAPESNDGITQILAQGNGTPGEAAALAPRMVRTVTVLPDGRIVDAESTPADGEPAAETPAGEADAAVASPPEGEAPAAEDPAAETPVAETPEEAPVADADPAPAPEPQPDDVANVPAASLDAPPLGTPIAPGFYVQVSAQGSEDAARAQLAEFRGAAPSILGDQPAVIQRAELPQGTYFRVQFGPMASQAEADQLRQQLASVGIDSFVTTN